MATAVRCAECSRYIPETETLTIVSHPVTRRETVLCPGCATRHDQDTPAPAPTRAPSRYYVPTAVRVSTYELDSLRSSAGIVAANPAIYEGGGLGHEGGGWLFGEDRGDGLMEVVRHSEARDPDATENGMRLSLDQLSYWEAEGWTAVGDWHAHPDRLGEEDPRASSSDMRGWMRGAQMYQRAWISAIGTPSTGLYDFRFDAWYMTTPDGTTVPIEVEVWRW